MRSGSEVFPVTSQLIEKVSSDPAQGTVFGKQIEGSTVSTRCLRHKSIANKTIELACCVAQAIANTAILVT
jgi:hypothetical protein